MKSRATRFLPNPKKSINKLEADITGKIVKALDTAPQERNWRAFIIAMVEKFPYRQQEIEGFALHVNHSFGSPARKLWNSLGSRGFKVEDLIKYLDALKWEDLLYDLKPYEAIKVLKWPPEKVKLQEGDTLTLMVEATGFPYPRYQWFRANSEVPGAMENILLIKSVSTIDEGSYCCRLHNSADIDQVVFTPQTAVLVRASPQQGQWPLENPPPERPVGQRPEIVLETRECSICVHVGELIHLQCKATGTLPLEYRWLKNGQIQPCLSEDFVVPRATVIDSGNYECIVKNRHGETKSKLFVVKVRMDTKSSIEPPSIFGELPVKVPQKYKGPLSLDILRQPKSCAVEKGGSALFSCEVLGEPPVRYQWYKDGVRLPGETLDHVAIRTVNSYDQEGCFQCRVWNNSSELLTGGAYLRLDLEASSPFISGASKYTATDKFALLIGNYDYIAADVLKAPKSDVVVLAEIFKALDFKVVSLLNLTLGEMEAAVKEFCNLIKGDGSSGSGVYCVFYFCGHGIEDTGQCYLVPQDAPTGYTASDCLCAQKVLQQMQRQSPALCTMIIDCCRIVPDSPPETRLSAYFPLPVGNFVYLFATTQGMRAWEYEENNQEPNGVLVKHLQRHIGRRQPVEVVFASVREDINADPGLREYQIPEVKSNLVEPLRSLADKIEYTGHTELFTRRQMKWQNAHVQPEDRKIMISSLGVEVDVKFQSDFSNVMSIYLTVEEPGDTIDCQAWVVNLPPTLSVLSHPCDITHNPVRTKTVIQDIQKLKEPLSITIRLQYRNKTSNKEQFYEHHPTMIGLPLISTLQLWKGETELIGPNSQSREPIEQGDDFLYSDGAYSHMRPHYENLPANALPPYENLPPFERPPRHVNARESKPPPCGSM